MVMAVPTMDAQKYDTLSANFATLEMLYPRRLAIAETFCSAACLMNALLLLNASGA
jgi:hypothetical protein